jgi:hypothetical protein
VSTLIILALIFGAITAMLANRYERSGCAWFALGFFFGPFALIALLIESHKHVCSHCRSGISQYARICPHCRSELPGVSIDPDKMLPASTVPKGEILNMEDRPNPSDNVAKMVLILIGAILALVLLVKWLA